MSHFANPPPAERVFQTTPHYQQDLPSTDIGAQMAMTSSYAVANHGQLSWSPFYAERPAAPVPQPSSSYILPTNPASSTSTSFAVPSEWQSATTSSALASAGQAIDNSGFQSGQPCSRGYQPSPDSYASRIHPRLAERTPEAPSYTPLYNFRDDRDRSPSSVSEYTGWDSPKSAADPQEPEPEYRTQHFRDDGTDHHRNLASQQPPLRASASGVSSFQTSVKVEDHDDCFIMELSGTADMFPGGKMGGAMHSRRGTSAAHLNSLSLSQSLAPPTEVPLRATQASEEMRARMGVFRLNPFTMHSLSVNADDAMAIKDDVEWEALQPSWCGGEPHALEEEPLLYEFQLDLYDSGEDGQAERPGGETRSEAEMAWSGSNTRPSDMSQAVGSDDRAHLQSFSPDFELHPEGPDFARDPSHESDSCFTQNMSEDRETHHDNRGQDHAELSGEVDYASRSEVDSSSTTTRSVHTPFTGSPHATATAFEHQHGHSPPLQPSVWDAVNEQYYPSEETHFPATSLLMGSKSPMELGSNAGRVPRMHATSSHPYMHRSPPYQHAHAHSQPHTQASPHAHLQPSGFLLLNQPTHHSLQHSYASQQSSYLSHEPSYLQSPYQENGSSSSMPNVMMCSSAPNDSQRVDMSLSPPYMRVIRGPRSQDNEYRQENSIYDHRTASRAERDARGYPSSLQAVAQPASAAMIPHYIAHIDSSVAGNRRWSLPETVTGRGQGGQFLS